VHFETPIHGTLDERDAIYRALVGMDGCEECDDATEAAPTDYACLGCGTVTTARERPVSCPACYRTPGDRRPGALFQHLG